MTNFRHQNKLHSLYEKLMGIAWFPRFCSTNWHV